jgi:predicted acylesterase/phospholipase RssA
MKVGFSLSPGGLLLPYHLGVLDALEHHGLVNENTPLAGSSAGAIATASKAAKIDSRQVLESTMNICDQCFALGGARGRIMPLLKQNLMNHVGAQEFDTLQKRSGAVAIAYMEIFPEQKSVLQTGFRDRFDLISAVCQSSMFPFFTSNWPAILNTSRQHSLFRWKAWGVQTLRQPE